MPTKGGVKSDFLKHGDSNSKWFHARAKMRCKQNFIAGLEKNDGSWAESDEEVKEVVTDYFAQLFTTEQQDRLQDVLEHIPTRVTAKMNNTLMRAYSADEIF